MIPLTMEQSIAFRKSLAIGETAVLEGNTVYREGVFTFYVNGNRVVGIESFQKYMVELSYTDIANDYYLRNPE